MELFNGTKQKQQIHLINGNAVTVFPNEVVEIDINTIYDFELLRISAILTQRTTAKKIKVVKKVKKRKKVIKVEPEVRKKRKKRRIKEVMLKIPTETPEISEVVHEDSNEVFTPFIGESFENNNGGN